ncbi:MAG: hypothetical protein ABL933_17175 [Methyloglobulus sp.]
MLGWVVFIFVIGLIVVVLNAREEKKRKERVRISLLPPEEQQQYLDEKKRKQDEKKRKQDERSAHLAAQKQEGEYGLINKTMMCPHCQTNGKIRTKHITQKKGISGGKAVATILTGGLSLIAVGLSRKEEATQAHCDNCNNTWLF